MKFSTNEDVDAPIEAAFDMFSDFNALELAVKRRGADVQRTDQMAQPGVGMKWRAAFDLRGKRRQVDVAMVRFDRPNEMQLEGTSSGMNAVSSFHFMPLSPQRTRVRVELEITPLNLSARLMVQSMRLAKNGLNTKFKLNVADYARRMEGQYTSKA